MASLNQINLIGNAGKDADMSYTATGRPVTKFSLAVNDYVGKDSKGEAQYKTTWFNIVVWGNTAETANTLVKKGGSYFVTGRLSLRDYEDRNGQTRTAVEVVADKVAPVGNKPAAAGSPAVSDDDLGDLEDHPF